MTTTIENSPATLEQLVASTKGKRRFKTVGPLPVCGLTVRIRSLTERELSSYEAGVVGSRSDEQRQARLAAANRALIALCLVDGDGNRIVQDNQAKQLAEMDAADSRHLYEACAKHVGINATDVEELVKNSEPTTPTDSPTS